MTENQDTKEKVIKPVRTCPYCKSEKTESKGMRGKNKRFVCKACGKQHTRDIDTWEVITTETAREKKEPETKKEEEAKRKPNIQISEDQKTWLDSLKVIPQEPYEGVLKRIKEQLSDLPKK